MKVLVGSIGTPESDAAVAAAVEEARDRGGEVHLVVHVPPPSNEKEARDHATLLSSERQRVNDEAARISTETGVRCEGHFLQGSGRTSHAILEQARELAVDRIVIGTRRRSQVGKLLLGSTASDLILGANCPVLCVKAAD